jgi:hypothetical protein
MLWWQALYTFLNDMARELVANTFQQFVFELFGYHDLLIVLPYIQSLKQRQQAEVIKNMSAALQVTEILHMLHMHGYIVKIISEII